MEQIVGTAYSETTEITYKVRWDSDGGDVWIKDPDKEGWIFVGTDTISAEDAIVLAQGVIDDQKIY